MENGITRKVTVSIICVITINCQHFCRYNKFGFFSTILNIHKSYMSKLYFCSICLDDKLKRAMDQFLEPPRINDDAQPKITARMPGFSNRSFIVILTYMRSGSSLTGDILQQHPGSFYIFEPLHRTTKVMKEGQPIFMQNGQAR